MLPDALRKSLEDRIAALHHPDEAVVDVMFMLQSHFGYLSDEAMVEGAAVLGMDPLKLEELATFYDFLYREPVGEYVIHACDGVVCWMFGEETLVDYLCRSLAINVGETTADGMFTVLPSACIGYCDHAPAVLINGVPYGPLTPESIDELLEKIRREHPEPVMDR